MKRVLWTLGLVVLLAAPSYAGGGLGFFAANWDTKEANNDTGTGIEGNFPFTTSSKVDLQLRLAQYRELETEVGDLKVTINAMPLDLGVVYNFYNSAKVTPRIGAGITYFILSSNLNRLSLDSGTINGELGYFGEVGLDIPFDGNWAIYADALYRIGKSRLEGEGLNGFTQRRVGLNGADFHLGLKWRW